MAKLLEGIESLHSKLNKKQETLSPFFLNLGKPTIAQIYSKRAADCEKVRNVDIGPFPGRNCRYLPLEDVKYIYGPCKFDYYKINGRNFYIFGETHLQFKPVILSPDIKPEDIHPATTLLFSSFIHSLVNQNSKNYDLFIEDSFDIIHDLVRDTVIKDPTIKDTISDSLIHINSEFKNCIFKDLRRDCPYENLRVHSVDYREFPLGVLTFAKYFNNAKFKKFNEDPRVNNTPKFINSYTTDYIKNLLRLLESRKIKKQFERIEDARIIKPLYHFLKSKIESIDITIPFDKNRLIKLSSFIMDMYALPRIFRTFDNTQKSHRQFTGQAENVIYYAGSSHTETLKEFMHSIGIEPIKSIGADIDICSKPYMKIDKSFLDTFK